MHTHVYDSTMHKNKILEAAYMSSADEWIKKIRYLHSVEYYSAMEDKFESFCRKMDAPGRPSVATIMLSEINQTHEPKYHMVSLI